MKFKSEVLTQASGSIGGVTYSHNTFGMYRRARAIPADPNTPAQTTIRAQLSMYANTWVTVLNATQRESWAVYAANVPLIDKLGDPVFVTGFNMFVRTNVMRGQFSIPAVLSAPTEFAAALMSAPVVTASEATQLVSVAYTNSNEWATAVGGAMVGWVSKPQNPTINFFKGPFTATIVVPGAVVPPVSPATFAAPFAFVAGQRLFVRIRVTTADGRLGAPLILQVTAAA